MKEFKALLEDLSVKRFPKLSPEERKAAMEKLVSDKGPQTAGTTVRYLFKFNRTIQISLKIYSRTLFDGTLHHV